MCAADAAESIQSSGVQARQAALLVLWPERHAQGDMHMLCFGTKAAATRNTGQLPTASGKALDILLPL